MLSRLLTVFNANLTRGPVTHNEPPNRNCGYRAPENEIRGLDFSNFARFRTGIASDFTDSWHEENM